MLSDAVLYDAILFDMDGVLVDSEIASARAWVETLAEHGLPLEQSQFMSWAVGSSVPNLYTQFESEHGWTRPESFEAALLARLGEAFSKVQEVPGAALTLQALKKAGIPFAIASNSVRERLHPKLRAAGLAELVGAHAYDPAHVGGLGKPLPDLYLYAARQLGKPIERCLVVEDSLPGLAAGLSAGAVAWAFTGGGHDVDGEALVQAGAERVVASHAELREQLGL